jgi:hypothetical protein
MTQVKVKQGKYYDGKKTYFPGDVVQMEDGTAESAVSKYPDQFELAKETKEVKANG